MPEEWKETGDANFFASMGYDISKGMTSEMEMDQIKEGAQLTVKLNAQYEDMTEYTGKVLAEQGITFGFFIIGIIMACVLFLLCGATIVLRCKWHRCGGKKSHRHYAKRGRLFVLLAAVLTCIGLTVTGIVFFAMINNDTFTHLTETATYDVNHFLNMLTINVDKAAGKSGTKVMSEQLKKLMSSQLIGDNGVPPTFEDIAVTSTSLFQPKGDKKNTDVIMKKLEEFNNTKVTEAFVKWTKYLEGLALPTCEPSKKTIERDLKKLYDEYMAGIIAVDPVLKGIAVGGSLPSQYMTLVKRLTENFDTFKSDGIPDIRKKEHLRMMVFSPVVLALVFMFVALGGGCIRLSANPPPEERSSLSDMSGFFVAYGAFAMLALAGIILLYSSIMFHNGAVLTAGCMTLQDEVVDFRYSKMIEVKENGKRVTLGDYFECKEKKDPKAVAAPKTGAAKSPAQIKDAIESYQKQKGSAYAKLMLKINEFKLMSTDAKADCYVTHTKAMNNLKDELATLKNVEQKSLELLFKENGYHSEMYYDAFRKELQKKMDVQKPKIIDRLVQAYDSGTKKTGGKAQSSMCETTATEYKQMISRMCDQRVKHYFGTYTTAGFIAIIVVVSAFPLMFISRWLIKMDNMRKKKWKGKAKSMVLSVYGSVGGNTVEEDGGKKGKKRKKRKGGDNLFTRTEATETETGSVIGTASGQGSPHGTVTGTATGTGTGSVIQKSKSQN